MEDPDAARHSDFDEPEYANGLATRLAAEDFAENEHPVAPLGNGGSCVCLENVTARSKVLKHNEPGVKTFRCPNCPKSFAHSGSLTDHMRTHIGETFCCPHCHKSFAQSGNVRRHIRTHSGETPFRCPHCPKSFAQSGNLTRHIRTHSGEKPFRCPHCPKSFARSGNLREHVRTHSGKKPFRCPHCPKSFPQSGDLTDHLRTHSREKPFRCPHCPKSFTQSGKLTNHIRTHSGEKPYRCPHCPKSFARSVTLRHHIHIHTGEKPFKCPLCPKSFVQKSNLNSHIRTHPRKQTLTCPTCSRKFVRRDKLNDHIKYIYPKPIQVSKPVQETEQHQCSPVICAITSATETISTSIVSSDTSSQHLQHPNTTTPAPQPAQLTDETFETVEICEEVTFTLLLGGEQPYSEPITDHYYTTGTDGLEELLHNIQQSYDMFLRNQ